MPNGNGCYCCKCSEGPWLWALHGACIFCNHRFCDDCPQVYIPPVKSNSVQRPNSVIRKRANRKVQKRLVVVLPYFQRNLMSLLRQRSTSRMALKGYYSTCSFSTTLPGVAVAIETGLDVGPYRILPQTPAPDTYISETQLPSPSDGEAVWTCCQCGHGGCLVSTTPACIGCGHPRDSCCETTEV
jgi:hypothetical protein